MLQSQRDADIHHVKAILLVMTDYRD